MNFSPKIRDGLMLTGILVSVFALWFYWQWLLTGLWPKGLGTSTALADRGQVGDSYGGLNALFTGMAFAGVAFTIHLQLKENRIRENERREQTADRLEREKDRLIEKFEDRFFKLTDVLRAHVHSLALSERTGKSALSVLVEKQSPTQYDADSTIEGTLRRHELVYGEFQNILGPYFRLLYRIIKFTDESSVPNKESYTGILRAELGNAELWLLALNCLSWRGENFKPLLVKYHFLKHLASRGHHWDAVEKSIRAAYPPSAFKDV